MDASTFTAYRLDQQRAADLDREHALRVSHRERREAGMTATPLTRPRGLWPFGRRSTTSVPAADAAPACDPASLALAGPSS
ncbi:MAG TPA: hypothetical protein VI121_03660 [Agromyces sp.]